MLATAKVFISYNHEDKNIANQLKNKLVENNIENQRGQYHLILYSNILQIKPNTPAQTSNKGIILGGDRKPAQFKQQGEIK